MTTIPPTVVSNTSSRVSARRRFLAALGLFFAWITFLVVLGMLSATGPGDRTPPVEIEHPSP